MTVGGLFLATVALAMLSPATDAAPARPSTPLELVSRFPTYYPPGQPRVINIRRAAVLLDGALVAPGAALFSQRTAWQAHTRARLRPSTFHFRADSCGLGRRWRQPGRDDALQRRILRRAAADRPHASFVLYQQVSQGSRSDDLVGRPGARLSERLAGAAAAAHQDDADLDHGLAYSHRLGRHVSTVTYPATNYVRPRTVYIKDATLPPGTQRVLQSAGASGFSISYTRRVYEDDSVRREERYSWTYSPENQVIAIAGR